MNTVTSLRAPRVLVQADGIRRRIGEYARPLGRRALIVTDQRFATTAHYEDIVRSLEAHGVQTSTFDESLPELPSSQVSAVAALAADAELIVAVGGGSCLDLAKVAAVVRTYGGAVQDYFGEHRVPGPVLPIIAVPTTAGTGSEATPVAVVTDTARGVKLGVSSPHIVPHTALVDPELTHTSPPALTASVGADALSHLVESFTAIQRDYTGTTWTDRVFLGKGALTDALAREGLRLVAANLRTAVEDGLDAEARRAMCTAATFGGLTLGTAGTAAAHALQYPIGTLTHTPHGVGVGVLLPYVMRFNKPAAIGPLAEIGDVFGAQPGGSLDTRAEHAIDAVAGLLAAIGIPRTLRDLGMPEDSLGWAAHEALASARLVDNNPRPLGEPELHAILSAAFTGDTRLLESIPS
jgi:alcohol dehydrogenase